jgi:type VI secretion system protein ImpL
MKLYWGAGAALLGYLFLAWLAGSALHLDASRFYLLFGVLAALGIGGAVVFIWLWSKIGPRSGAGGGAPGVAGALSGPDDEIDFLVRDAAGRLASSNLAQGAKLSNLPVVFVIGEPGSTKTSTLLNSGLDPELLAGNVYQDNAVAPTRVANFWYARGMVFVEAGGKLLSEPKRWARLLQHFQPGRLRSVAGGGQAPRAALLCFDAETFTRPGSADALTASARTLQARLGEISQRFGISFPVYVLFTKMNRVAFFEDFVRNLSNQEASQVLGATLPMARSGAAGIYAEVETRRLSEAFDGLFYSLADRRIVFLPRENDPQKVPAAYEFPREFRKLRNGLVQFLVDLCRPSQLRASPFLRGFYFSGVRPVVVHDTPVEAPRPSAQQSPFEAAGSATTIFRAGPPAPAAGAPLAQAAAGGRRAPQWVFLGHLFSDLILRDETALGASGSSTKTSTLRRALLVSAAALCLVFTIGFTVSFFGNRALENQVLDAARAIPPGEASGLNLPTPEALQKLDNLRGALVQLTANEERGAPLGLRWFLYSGSAMYPHARRLYYARFHQLLFAQTQGAMLASLQRVALPPAPTDDYGATYDTLKAYLITTSEWKRSTNWLSPVLVSRWSAGRLVDNLLPLARKQFDFYSEDLARGNPFSEQNDAAAIDRARLHLSKFSGTEQIYQFMLSDASRRTKKINFNEQFPGSAEVVVNNRDVLGAFTKPGWAAMQENLRKAVFSGERWVLGDYAAAKPAIAQLEQELQNRYTSDYIARWREFLRNTVVVRYGNLTDAAKKLNVLSGAQTPLLALFWVASQNTAVDSPKVTEAFDAVQKVVPPPATTVQYVWPTNQEYMTSLAALQTAISQVADAPGPPDPNRAAPVRTSADAAHNVVKKMGYTFKIDPEDHLETTTLKLLQAPIDYADALTKGIGAGEINNQARQFCLAFAPIAAKFPFNPTATAEVSLPELGGIFRPREGKLWTFYAESLQNLLQKQGAQYVANPAGGVQLTPAFTAFFNSAARFSDAMYPAGAAEPNLHYALTAQRSDQIGEMTVIIDGQTVKSSGQDAAHQYVWSGAATSNIRISAKLTGGSDFEFQNRDGLWSLFRFFADADRFSPSGSGSLLEWVVRQGREGRPVMVAGKPLTYQFLVDTGGAAPVFQKDFLNGLHCVSQAAR